MQKRTNRGGKREGAGRKPEGKKLYSVTLVEEIAERAKERTDNFSGLIDRLLARWVKRQT